MCAPPFALATCLVGGVVWHPPIGAYLLFAHLGVVLALIPMAVVDLLDDYGHERPLCHVDEA